MAQHAAAFAGDTVRIVQVVEYHRHENQIRRTVADGKRFCGTVKESDAAVRCLFPGLRQHFFRRLDTNQAGIVKIGKGS